MKILPIQFQTTNYTNNRNKKPFYVTQPQSVLSTPNVDFRGMVGLYKGLKNDVTLLSKEEATELVKKNVKSCCSTMENVIDTVLRTTEQIKDNVGQNKYYRGMINEFINLAKDGFCLGDIIYLDDNNFEIQKDFESQKHFESQKDFDTHIKKVRELAKMGCSKDYCWWLWNQVPNTKECKKLIELRQKSEEKREMLSSPIVIPESLEYISSDDMDALFYNDPKSVLKTVKILGEKSFLASFEKKYYAVRDLIFRLGEINTDLRQFEDLLKLTNPRESKKYLKNEAKIKKLKSQFQTTQNKEKLIKDINAYTDENKNLVANSFKDYNEKIELANIYKGLQENNIYCLKAILKNWQANSTNRKDKFDHFINNFIREDRNGYTCRCINFIDSKYLRKMCEADEDFRNNFEYILYMLNNTLDDPAEMFDKMPMNIATKKQFEDLGINYDKWTKFNPESKIQKNVVLNVNERKQFVIKNIEKDLTSEFWNNIPKDEYDKFFAELSKNGYTLKEVQVANYEKDGFVNGKTTISKLFKDGEPVKFGDLSLLFKTIYKYMGRNSFWTAPNSNYSEERSIREITNHLIDLRSAELRLANQASDDKLSDITVRKVDMNDIKYSLFLGNYASCCTAVGSGCNQWSAPNYIMTKMVSAIEILDGKEPVGNTMCYIADIDGKPSLLLDNIELQNKYQYNDEIRDMIFEYAEKLTAEIGKPDMPIYAGQSYHKVNLEEFALENKKLKLIGTNDEFPFYIDFFAKDYVSSKNEKFTYDWYRIK